MSSELVYCGASTDRPIVTARLSDMIDHVVKDGLPISTDLFRSTVIHEIGRAPEVEYQCDWEGYAEVEYRRVGYLSGEPYETMWRCPVCGYVHVGRSYAPDVERSL